MPTDVSRRVFFRQMYTRLLSGVSLFAVGGMGWDFLLTPGRIRLEQAISAGQVDEVRQGITMLKEHGIALVRSGDSIDAVSLTCTHLGCTIAQSGNGFACPCHGSRFDSAGRVLNGPALAPLPRYALKITDDREVIVDIGSPLSKA